MNSKLEQLGFLVKSELNLSIKGLPGRGYRRDHIGESLSKIKQKIKANTQLEFDEFPKLTPVNIKINSGLPWDIYMSEASGLGERIIWIETTVEDHGQPSQDDFYFFGFSFPDKLEGLINPWSYFKDDPMVVFTVMNHNEVAVVFNDRAQGVGISITIQGANVVELQSFPPIDLSALSSRLPDKILEKYHSRQSVSVFQTVLALGDAYRYIQPLTKDQLLQSDGSMLDPGINLLYENSARLGGWLYFIEGAIEKKLTTLRKYTSQINDVTGAEIFNTLNNITTLRDELHSLSELFDLLGLDIGLKESLRAYDQKESEYLLRLSDAEELNNNVVTSERVQFAFEHDDSYWWTLLV